MLKWKLVNNIVVDPSLALFYGVSINPYSSSLQAETRSGVFAVISQNREWLVYGLSHGHLVTGFRTEYAAKKWVEEYHRG